MKYKIMTAITGGILLIFLFFPEIVLAGAKEGLLMWFQVVLPALLPFSIFSMMINCCGMTAGFAKVFGPFFRKCFCINRAGCYPIIMGMLSGFPVGALNVADVYRKGDITKREAQRIMALCNNPSPMFLVAYLGINCMHLEHPILILLVVYGSAWIWGMIDGFLGKIRGNAYPAYYGKEHSQEFKREKPGTEKRTFIGIMDECILKTFVIMTKVGGYIIVFSILAELIRHLFARYEILPGVLVLFLEITAGAREMTNGNATEIINGIVLGMVSFGGLSGVAQTASVIEDTDLSMKQYIIMKGRQGILAGGLGYLLISIFA